MADNARDSTSTEKKRSQNRVAQRLYRQRMKAKMEVLQAKLDLIEENGQQLDLRPGDVRPEMRTQRSTSSTDYSVNMQTSHDPHQLFSTGIRHRAQQSRAPIAKMVPDDRISDSSSSNSSGGTLPSKVGVQHKKASQASTWGSTGKLNNGQVSIEGAQTTSYEFEPTSNFDIDYAATSNFQYDAMELFDDMNSWDLNIAPSTTSVEQISTQVSPPDSSLSTDPMQTVIQLPFLQSFEKRSDSGHQAWDPCPINEQATKMDESLQTAWICPAPEASFEERLNFVLEQARLVGFKDLDDLITAYHSIVKDNAGETPSMVNGSGRRLPQLIATIRHATREWKDWERRGFPLD